MNIQRFLILAFIGALFSRAATQDFDLKIENAVQVSFQPETGKLYQIESSPDVSNKIWTPEDQIIEGAGSRYLKTFLIGDNVRKIYRIAEVRLTTGLVGYYPFNGNANDESGNGNDGIISGATLGTNRFGIIGNSYLFTATGDFPNWLGDYITTSHANGFPEANGDLTISFWFNLSQFGSDYHIFFADGEPNKFQLGLDVFSGSQSDIQFYSGALLAPDLASASLQWDLQKWYNIQLTRAGNLVTIYRDGILVAQGNVPVSDGTGILDFGFRTHPNNHPLWGQMDDIRIYNRPLFPSELKALKELQE